MKVMTKKPFGKTILFLYISLALSMAGCMQQKADPAIDNIKSIQAYTDLCFYGQKLTKIEITYKKNVNLSNVTTDTYTLMDRGYTNPDFAEIIIESADINGQVVTLDITEDTEALEDNALIYSGDNATGSRSKNPVGLKITGLWYRSVDDTIYYGNEDSEVYKANTSREGYQTRECLELKLWHTGESIADAACMANEDGSYYAEGLWLPTIDAKFGVGGFQSFEDLGINVPTTATDGEQYVRGWAYFPEGFDSSNPEKKYRLIISLPGAGTAFWRLPDGTNNFGTGPNFDGSAIRWMDSGAIVLYIQDRSHGGGDGYQFWVDDYNVIRYFIENYNADPEAITLTGNSRGTFACNTIASAYPGLINTLLIINGSMGRGIAGRNMFAGTWTSTEWQDAAKYGLKIWAFDGEQNSNNIENYQTAISYYQAAGISDEWIADNLRLTGYPSQWFYYWGETDHLATKMTYWYFYDNLYYGPDGQIVEGGELVYNTKLNPGDTYQLNGRLVDGVYNKEGFNYVVYGNTVKDWVLSRDYQTR